MQRICPLRRHLLASASFCAASVFLVPVLGNAAFAGALPAGGQYVAGKGAIGGNSGSLVVKQSSTTGIINWNSFSIGKNNSVTFDNGAGATLNEVTGGSLSTIAGALHASGSVFLINQAGVIVSGSGKIVTGGSFGASTGDDSKRGNIVVAGKIQSLHGNVSLSGANVSVPGSIAVMRGGHLWLTSSGTTAIAGALDADNAHGAGGTIVATGKSVDVAATANISASGASKGGTILLGGDVHGGTVAADNFVKSAVADAETTTIAEGAHITANANQGAGGDIVIWSDGHTSFDGAISAKGTTAGGFAEVSSHDLLAFEGAADLTARDGKTGTLLLDPENVTIENGTTSNGSLNGDTPTNTFTPSGDNSILSVSDLQTALGSANVTITTGSTGSQAGTITVLSGFTWSAHTLTLDAYGSIYIDAHVRATGTAGLTLIDADTTSTGVNDGNPANGDLYFINGRVSFANTSESLSINGNAYTLVNSVAGLASAVSGDASGYYALSDNYDATPDGTYTQSPVATTLTGTFDGLGNKISNLSIAGLATDLELGLFSEISGTVRDLDLSNVDIVASGTTVVATGALAGDTTNATVENVGVSGSVTASGGSTSNAVGGLAGLASGGELLNDHSSVTVTDSGSSGSQPTVGGLVGYNASAIRNSYESGNVVAGSGIEFVGGVVGLDASGSISNSGATGNVSSSANSYIGGFAGYVDPGASIQTSYATGAVTSTASGSGVGGFVGANDGAINQSYSTGNATDTGGTGVGGFAGFNFDGTIDQSYSAGQASSAAGFAGGFAGENQNSSGIGSSKADYYNSTANSGPGVGSDAGTSSVHGLTLAQMQTASSFVGWTFGTTGGGSGWAIVDVDGSLNNAGGAAGGTTPMLEAEYSKIITTAHQLQLMALAPTASYTLGTDIDASGTAGGDVWGAQGFIPIGGNNASNSFTGTFNGQGNTIANVFIDDRTNGLVGVFGYVNSEGTIENVGLIDANVTSTASYDVGTLVGDNAGNVSGVYSSGSVTGSDTNVGGLAGSNAGTMEASHSNATLTGSDGSNVGGLAGLNDGSIAQSYANGTVTSDFVAGGLVGYNREGTVQSSFADATVTAAQGATGGVLGGLVGENAGTIQSSTAGGSVTGNGAGDEVGGVIGYQESGSTTTSYSTAAVTGSGSGTYVGGFVGYARGGTIDQSYEIGTAAATEGAVGGGFAGLNQATLGGTIAVYFNSDANSGTGVGSGTAISQGGGLSHSAMQSTSSFVGWTFATTPDTTGWVIVDVDGTLNNAGSVAGGTTPLLLDEYSTTITNAHQLQLMALDLGADYTLANNIDATATGTGKDVWGAGGFAAIGGNNADPFTGDLNGENYVIDGLTVDNTTQTQAGLFGEFGGTVENLGLMNVNISTSAGSGVAPGAGALAGASYGVIDAVYATGTVTATQADDNNTYAGGLVGFLDYGTIDNSHAAVTVTAGAGSGIGGLAGIDFAGGTIENSYATGSASGGVDASTGGLIGFIYEAATISNVFATGAVSGGDSANVGGLIGEALAGTISDSHATGTVNGGGNGVYGGFIGEDGAAITQSYATGTVSKSDSATGGDFGGFAGGVDKYGTIAQSYATGAVTVDATATAGGFVGSNGGAIEESYSRGIVTGGMTGQVGGFAGDNVMIGVIGDVTEVYYETTGNGALTAVGTNTGVSVNIGGIADMTNPANFTAWTDFGGLNSGQTWVTVGADGSVDGVSGTTPMLLSEYSTTVMSSHQLQLMELDPTANYTLGKDIDASGTAGGNVWGANGFIAIGGNGAPSDFTGSFDGGNHAITGLTIDDSTNSNVGLFGVVDLGATIMNVTLADVSVQSSSAGALGGLVGNNSGTISGASVSGSISGSNSDVSVGGIAGYNSAAISNSFSTAAVSATADGSGQGVGGLVGFNNGGSISQSSATGNVSMTGDDVVAGGLVGVNGGTITQSFATGAVTLNDPETSSGNFAGGLAGSNDAGSITDSYAMGSVTMSGGSTSFGGGLVGGNINGGVIQNSYSLGMVTAAFAGGLVGDDETPGDITNSFWDTQTTGITSLAQGAGSTPSDSGITGLSTAQLQAALPGSFSASTWSIVPDTSFPYLNWQFSGTPEVIAGKVLSGYGGTGMSDASVDALAGGTPLSSALTGGAVTTFADGYYYYLLSPGTLATDGSGAVLVYRTGSGGASFEDNLTNGSTGNLDIYDDYFHIVTSASNYTTVQSPELSETIGTDNAVQTIVDALPNLAIDALGFASGTFDLDSAIDTSGNVVLTSENGTAITQSAAITAGSLLLEGAGSFTLTNSGNAFGTLAGNVATAHVFDSSALTVGSVDGVSGLASSGAVTLGDSSSLTLADSVNVGSNTLTLDAGTTIAQSGGAITAGTLIGSSSGAVTLTGANAIADLGAFTTGDHAFSLTDADALTVESALNVGPSANVTLTTTGSGHALTLDAAVTGVTIDLVSAGTIASDSAGTITATTLEGSSSGGATLTAANDIGALGAFTTGNGAFTLTDAASLTVNGALDAGSGNMTLTTTGSGHGLTLDAAVTGATVDLASANTIASDSAGIVTATTLEGTSSGAATLIAANIVTDLGAFATGSGAFSLTDAHALTVDGALNAGTGNATLTTTGSGHALTLDAAVKGATVDLVSASTIASDSAGIITATKLTGSSAGAATLTAANIVTDLGAFATGNGAFSLTDAASLTVNGALNAGSGNVTLTTTGSGHALILDAAVKGATVDLVSASTIASDSAGIITATKLTGSSAGADALTAANAIADLGAFATGNGAFSLTDAASLTVNGALNAGSGNVTLTTTGSGHALTLDAAVKGGTVDLVSASTIASDSAGIITATKLTGSSAGADTLTAANAITDLGAFATGNGAFSLTDAASLTVNGALNAGSGNVTLTTMGSGHVLTLDAAVKGATVDLVSASTITSDSAGIITATKLTGSSAGADTLTAANAITDLGAFTTGNGAFSLTDAASLTLNGAVDTGTGTLSLTTSGSGHNLAIDAHVTGKTVDLTSAGDVTETSAGAVIANLLNVTADTGISLTSAANDITTIGTDHTNSGSNTIDKH